MSNAYVFFAGFAALLFSIVAGSTDPGAPVACCAPSADATATAASPLDRIKALAGEWVRIDENGETTDDLISVYRVTAGGSAVIETLFPGQEMEMITLYHLDDGELVLTHYCMLGNQPAMSARTITDEKIVFECNGEGTFKDSEDEAHMHQGTLNLLGPDRMKTEWRELENGELVYTAAFEVVRRK